MAKDGLGPADAPVNQAAPRSAGQRVLLAVVIGLGLLILLAIGGVAIGVALKLKAGGPSSALLHSTALVLPAGARIEDMKLSGNRLVLKVKTDAGEEVDIVDTTDGHVVSRIAAAAPELPH